MTDIKYVVIKREAFLDFIAGEIETADLQGHVVEDAVVIRRQDVFSAPALEAYANSILAAVDAASYFADDTPEVQAKLKSLRDIADYFADQASEAWLTIRKLPD